MKKSLLLASAAALLSGCGLLYTNIHNGRAYRSATPADVKSAPEDETVSGSACHRSVLFLVAWGDGGYAAAAKDALGAKTGFLYDVKSDIKVTSVLLGLYTEVCTKVTGRLAKG